MMDNVPLDSCACITKPSYPIIYTVYGILLCSEQYGTAIRYRVILLVPFDGYCRWP